MNKQVVSFPETQRRLQDGWQEESYYLGHVKTEMSLRHPSGESKEEGGGIIQELRAGSQVQASSANICSLLSIPAAFTIST